RRRIEIIGLFALVLLVAAFFARSPAVPTPYLVESMVEPYLRRHYEATSPPGTDISISVRTISIGSVVMRSVAPGEPPRPMYFVVTHVGGVVTIPDSDSGVGGRMSETRSWYFFRDAEGDWAFQPRSSP
ncbi:MAG TPA: hypothetical protein VGE07_21275, partial [Herpetosiphonaceae bacterium]